MNTIAIIPARGGSKGIPQKNIKEFAGKPLIAHIIETALSVAAIDRVIVSTDSAEIAEIAKEYGAEVPFIRPDELARDETPTLPVLQHAIHHLEAKEIYSADVVVLLYPTSPLLKSKHIASALALLEDNDSVVSVTKDTGHYWKNTVRATRFYPLEVKNRQLAEPLYKENGAIYISKKESLLANKIVGDEVKLFVMDKKATVDIDTPLDFKFAEAMIKNEIL